MLQTNLMAPFFLMKNNSCICFYRTDCNIAGIRIDSAGNIQRKLEPFRFIEYTAANLPLNSKLTMKTRAVYPINYRITV